MLWAVLLPDPQPPSTDALDGLATWCLQFTPSVAILEASAVGMEVEGSARLFGGRRALAQHVREACGELGVSALSWAPNSLAALALARAGVRDGVSKPLPDMLDALPLKSLQAVDAQSATLLRLGCTTLGQVRALPRAGVSRRFGAPLLDAMDWAYGLRPEAHRWVPVPDIFRARLELMSRVEHAPAILFGARRLLLQLCAWLSARRAGVRTFTLHWCHDVMRAKTAGDGGHLTISTAETTRSIEHLSRLLAEHLAKVKLLAPVGDLELTADDVAPMEERSMSLLPDPSQAGESLALVLERVAARLGPEAVLRPVLHDDHRMEWQTHWQPAAQTMPRTAAACADVPQPSFMLPSPLRLAIRDDRPLYQGPLLMLSGPHRVEGGWWHLIASEAGKAAQNVVRDYWVASSEHAGVLWVFQARLAKDQSAWFLHGIFA